MRKSGQSEDAGVMICEVDEMRDKSEVVEGMQVSICIWNDRGRWLAGWMNSEDRVLESTHLDWYEWKGVMLRESDRMHVFIGRIHRCHFVSLEFRHLSLLHIR